jgi:hypothetical protein
VPKKDPRRSIYIAGKMRGLPLYGFPAFDEAEDRLISEGWIVRSPANHDRALGFDPEGPPPDPATLAEMHRWDMQTITESDAIYMLPGWEDSDGATRELGVARACGLDVYWADDATPPYVVDERAQPPEVYARTHWNGTTWTEPPDGEAAEPSAEHPYSSTCYCEECRPPDPHPAWDIAGHAFNRAVEASVARTQAISGQRGESYQDTWSEANLRTSFLDATLRSIAEQQGHHGADIELAALMPAERRLIVVASLCDVKLSRLIGEWKQDHVDDLENYAGAWNTWMGEYLEP